MDIDQHYELGEVVANDAESKTVRARQRATGQEVFLHLLFGSKPPGQQTLLSMLLQRSMDASPEKRKQILEISDFKGMPYVVTEVFPDFPGLRPWLMAERTGEPAALRQAIDPKMRAGVWKVPVMPTPQPAAAAPPAAGFTSLFRATVGDEPEAPVPAPPPVVAANPPEQVPPAPQSPSSTPPVAQSPVAAPVPPSAGTDAAKDAAMAGAAPPAPVPAPVVAPEPHFVPAPPPPAAASGESFTQMFQSPAGSQAPYAPA
ncbi:MAG: hypothetical protein ABSG25_03425, partial [Bryobacteraceae bacterium]